MRRIWTLAVCLILLAGCGGEEARSRYVLAMDTVMELTVYGSEESLDACAGLIAELDGLLSVTDPASAVSRLNTEGGGAAEGHVAALVELGLELGARTGGALDVTIRPVMAAWGFAGDGTYRVPGGEELSALLEAVDYAAVAWDGVSLSLPEGAELDFGAIAKGYAGDRAEMLLEEYGVTSALLNLGGSVHTVGGKPDGSPWRVAVKDPADPDGEYLGVLSLRGEAAVTSGGYERYFEENGVRYWHILSPETGLPAHSGLVSVTVVGEDGALCDGLSTALFVMGLEEALAHWRQRGDFEAVLVGEDGVVTVTAGLAETFELTSGAYTLSIAE